MMVHALPSVALPDPLHLEGWEEQDEPLATDPHSDEQAYCFMALCCLLNPDGHYVSKDRWLRMDPANADDLLLPDLLIARDLQARQWGVNQYLPWVVGKAWFPARNEGRADDVYALLLAAERPGGGVPIRWLPVDTALVRRAASLKAAGGLSYADCFAAAAAAILGCPVLTGDPEFRAVERAGIRVVWL